MLRNANRTRPNCALLYHPDGYRIDRTAVKGRQAAGAGFLKGFIERGGTDRLVALTDSRRHFEDFLSLARTLDPAGRPAVWARPLDRKTLRSVGTVFLPGPGFEREAWRRRFGSERDYSLCGVTHTVASDRVADALGRYLIAPTQPWDVLICTSTAVRSAVERMIEQHARYLERRGGGRFESPVRLPVIPLGVDCDALAPDGDDVARNAGAGIRRGLRDRLGIGEHDFVVLFVGRLSFHSKAHPTPMYMAAARAAQRVQNRRIHLLLAGQFPNAGIETEFREAAARFGDGTKVHFHDASDGRHRPAMLAADIFVSLSDNVQETFGLTPVEAMAAGLPCVVSDWNGYKDTVVEGETGFRIPTTSAAPGTGLDIADRYAAGLDSYDRMIGTTSLATSVDVDACADAFVRLAEDGELRFRLGAAGRERARRLYDWRVIIAAYQNLWAELAEIRATSPGVALRDRAAEPARNDFPDPFAIYQSHSTTLLGPQSVVAVQSQDPSGDLARLREGRLHSFVGHAFLSDAGVDALMGRLSAGPARVADLADEYPNSRRKLVRTLLWLGKFDLVVFEPRG